MFQTDWRQISVTSYIDQTRRNNVRVIWLGSAITFPNDILANIFNITKTKARECIIATSDDWIDFISDSCYSLSCEDGKSWYDLDGKKQLFLDWMATGKIRNNPHYQLDQTKFSNNIITTTFDTSKQKRLIVDGIHRSVALTIASETGLPIPEIKVMECYGDRVDVVFPCDIHQL